jgi:hypothetical protein
VAKFRLYIVQFFSIMLLLCSIFLDIQGDKEYDMHFNPDPLTNHYAIGAATVAPLNNPPNSDKATSISTEGKTTGKFSIGKFKSFESILPSFTYHPRYVELVQVKHTPALHPEYDYLYFEEINPPPPKLS